MSHQLIFVPEYPALIDAAWMTHLPHTIFIEAEDVHTGPLKISMKHTRAGKPIPGALITAAWTADFDSRNGRILEILFPGWRELEIFDEARAALQTIRTFAESPTSPASHHFGIKIAATCLVGYLDSSEDKLREELRTPFASPPC